MQLTELEWMSIKTVIREADCKSGSKHLILDGISYYVKPYSFYNEPDFDYELGTATITYLSDGVPLGLYDKYDFHLFSGRSIVANGITIGIEVLGLLYGAVEYELYTLFYLK